MLKRFFMKGIGFDGVFANLTSIWDNGIKRAKDQIP